MNVVVDPLGERPRRQGYGTLALLSAPRHLDCIDPADPDTLVVATEWLTWHEARVRGFDGVHFESADPAWPTAEAGSPTDLLLRSSDWVWVDGRDQTLYRGVSLGRLGAAVLGTAWQAAATLRAGLGRLARDHRPARIVLHDISAPFDVLGPAAKRRMVLDIAREVGAELIDRLDPPGPDEAAFPLRPGILSPQPGRRPTGRDRLRDRLSALAEGLFRLRLLGRRRQPRVFFYISLLSLRKLVDGFDGKGIVPVFPFGPSPKDRRFLGACWRGGLWPVRLGVGGPTGAHRAEAERITALYDSVWRTHPAEGLAAVHRESVRAALFAPGVLPGLMAMVDHLADLLDRLQIDRVVTGDSSSAVGRALCELALARGLPVDETLNGVFALPLANAPRCGDRGMPPTVTRELAMGPAALDWLDAQGARVERVVTGYPALGRFPRGPLAPPRLRHGLILPGYAFGNDIEATRSRIVSSIIETVRVMEALGFTGIRLKLHPGKDTVAFYRDLVARLGLPCEVCGGGGFETHLAWADLVVGPLGSSTFLETLAAGKPYYVMRPRPSSIRESMVPGAVMVDDAGQLAAALTAGRVPDRDRILDHWCGTALVADPVAATWEAITTAARTQPRRGGSHRA